MITNERKSLMDSNDTLTQALQQLYDAASAITTGEYDEEVLDIALSAARAALSATQPAQAVQGAGEVVAWLVSLENEPELGAWFAEEDMSSQGYVSKPLYTTPPQQPAPVVPEGFDITRHGDDTLYVSHDRIGFTALTDEEKSLEGRLLYTLAGALAATPTPPAQAAQAISYSDVVEREMMEMSDAALATHQQGGNHG